MVSAVSRFLSTLVDICLLRAGPQQLPHSSSLLVLCLIVYFSLDVALAKLSVNFVQPVAFALFDMGLMLGFAWFMLSFKGYYERFTQTAIAFSGSGILLGLVAWVLLSWQASYVDSQQAAALPSLLLLVHLIWNLAVISAIIRHAVSITLYWAWGVTLSYFFIYMIIIRLMAVAVS